MLTLRLPSPPKTSSPPSKPRYYSQLFVRGFAVREENTMPYDSHQRAVEFSRWEPNPPDDRPNPSNPDPEKRDPVPGHPDPTMPPPEPRRDPPPEPQRVSFNLVTDGRSGGRMNHDTIIPSDGQIAYSRVIRHRARLTAQIDPAFP